jgi:glycine dehydrogenase subunit 2
VLNASYVKVKLKDHLHLAYDRPCMHEAVFSDKNQHESGVSTLDIAKRLMDCGYHPPTIYFPLVVPGAIMIEPTETESLEDLDAFMVVFKNVVSEA